MTKKPDISRTTFVLLVFACGVVIIGMYALDAWYYRTYLLKYPPDRPLIQMERDECAMQERKGWPLSDFCKYR